MAEVSRFVPKSERERIHLIRQAHAKYDSVFPPADPGREQKGPISRTVSGANTPRNDWVLS